jgi:hypothetical protein
VRVLNEATHPGDPYVLKLPRASAGLFFSSLRNLPYPDFDNLQASEHGDTKIKEFLRKCMDRLLACLVLLRRAFAKSSPSPLPIDLCIFLHLSLASTRRAFSSV